MMRKSLKILLATMLLIPFVISCENRYHISPEDIEAGAYWGTEGVMPTIGFVYKESVNVLDNGDTSTPQKMQEAHLQYSLSADLIVDDYSKLEGGTCEWSAADGSGVSFQSTGGLTAVSALKANPDTGSYECEPVNVELLKNGTEADFDPDGVVVVKFKDGNGEYVTQTISIDAITSASTDQNITGDNDSDATTSASRPANIGEAYSANVVLNTADRHNIITVATSPSTVLFHRKDGLFQAGFTAYRGMLDLQTKIGSAMYEAAVKAPGGAEHVSSTNSKNNWADNITKDNNRITAWLANGDTVDKANGINSKAAFVASYGPPIALPAFRNDKVINYNRLRVALLRHNNYPVIITDDKKMYTIGAVTNFTTAELVNDYQYHIKANNSWFGYSGIDISDNPADLYKMHAGRVVTNNGVDGRFVNTIALTSDLDTTISLNETDKEYYIIGNANYNETFCNEKSEFENNVFNHNKGCTYQAESKGKIGAVKVPGLQRILGAGLTAVATDTEIYYTGPNGKGYIVDLDVDSENYYRIKRGETVQPKLVTFECTEHDHSAEELYAVGFAFANMNHALLPTMLLNDGSIVFTIRYYEDGQVKERLHHFYVNKDSITNDPNAEGNIKITHLLGPTHGYSIETGKMYYWTDIPALGVSYNPSTNAEDDDFLSFVEADPVSYIDTFEAAEKANLFKFVYGEMDIDGAATRLAGEKVMPNFAVLPYNPYNEARETVSYNDDNTMNITTLPYRPYRTNAFLFVNMNAGSKYSYIYFPHYFYGLYDQSKRKYSDLVMKKHGLTAAEVKHGSISKVFGAGIRNSAGFKYSPNGRNTTFFANKKGVFTFVDYDVRKTKSSCPGGDAACVNDEFKETMPDFFFRKNRGTADLPSADGRHKFFATPFVMEARMSNFPNTKGYETSGFQPQLLSSSMLYEIERFPDETLGDITASHPVLPGYVLEYWYNNIKGRFTSGNTSFGADFNAFTNPGNSDPSISNQYNYGIGLYRYYTVNATPVWRARKNNTEILQYLTRYGVYMPLSHGATAENIWKNAVKLFNDNKIVGEGVDSENLVTQRHYVTSLYALYDKDAIAAGTDLGAKVFGDITNNNITGRNDITTNGIGYIADKGNYMWRNQAPDKTGTGYLALDAFDFVVYHKGE